MTARQLPASLWSYIVQFSMITPRSLYFVDFDRTLFNTQQFFQDFSTILAHYFKLSGPKLRHIAKEHDRVRVKPTGIFSAFDVIREQRPDCNLDDIKRITRQELAGRTYTFADAAEFINALARHDSEMRIITVGADEYQYFKRDFAPELHRFPFIVTQQTKGAELKASQPEFEHYASVVLIDDRGTTYDDDWRDLGIKGIRLRRVDSTYDDEATPADVEEISSLAELVDDPA